MKRILLTVCMLLAACALWAQDDEAAEATPKEDSAKLGTVNFSNLFYTTCVRMTDGDIDEPDFYDEVAATFSNEKVFAFIKARARLTRGSKDDKNTQQFEVGDWEGIEFQRDEFDWTVKYMPATDWGLSLHESLFIPGTYTVVDDDNVHGGNIASHGFTVSYTGVPGLTVAASIPFDLDSDDESEAHNWDRDHKTNYFNGSDDDINCDGYTFRVGGGAWYENNLFSIGVAIHEIGRDDFSGGAYFTLSPLENLKFYGGYSYKNEASYVSETTDDEAIIDASSVLPGGTSGDVISAVQDAVKTRTIYDHRYINVNHVFNASFEFKPDIFVFAADYVGNVQNDIYAAVRFGVNVTDNTLVKIEGLYYSKRVASLDQDSDGKDPMFRIYPDVIIDMGKAGSLEAGAEVWFEKSDFAYIQFPVYWSYEF